MAIVPHSSMNKLAEQIADLISDISPETLNHEELNNLLGGNASGHYHLTNELLTKLQNVPESGIVGEKGEKGDKGDKGDPGQAATIEIGTVTTGAAGTSAKVVNVGTSQAARLNFTIPRGDKGERGDSGDSGGEGITDHEQLSNLLGGSANNHYHLRSSELQKLQNIPAMLTSGVGYEDWVFTLENGSTLTRRVVLLQIS